MVYPKSCPNEVLFGVGVNFEMYEYVLGSDMFTDFLFLSWQRKVFF